MTDLKTKIRSGDPVVGSWVSIGHTAVAEVTAMMDVDFALIDLEHTTIDLDTVQGMIHAIEATDGDTEAVVRPPDNDPIWIKRVLDTGTNNVMVPRVDSAEAARELVASTRYPPEGFRGLAGSRAAGYGLDFREYVETANDRILTIVQIETEAAIDESAEIAAVEGVDSLFVGPADLSGALGVVGEYDAPVYQQAVGTILDGAAEHDVPVGTFSIGAEGIGNQVDLGFDYVIAGKDTFHLADGTEAAAEAFRSAVEAAED